MRLTVFLLLVLVHSSCNLATEESSCRKTTQRFVRLFNQQDFRSIGRLFHPSILTNDQFHSLQDNLAYTYGVAGKISATQYAGQDGSKISYISFHENTAMDIIFQVDDRCQLISYLIKTHYPDSLPLLERNQTKLSLPFHGQWFVEWGGGSLDQNYHNAYRNMMGAFDFLKKDSNGKSFRNQGTKNKDYYAFGEEVIAPCQATVVKVIKGVADNRIDKPNALHTYGNAVVLKTANNEFLLLAHLKHKSIKVQEGQRVSKGAPLGQCGNSGYSRKPHLHFIVQNVADLFHPTGAKGHFDEILVDGSLQQDYSPIQGELISNP